MVINQPTNQPHGTNSSLKANCNSASQEVFRHLRNPKVHHYVHNSLPLFSILSQMHPLHTFSHYFPKIHSNIRPRNTPNIPCSKSHIYFLLCMSFRKISPIPRTSVTFRNKMLFTVKSATWLIGEI